MSWPNITVMGMKLNIKMIVITIMVIILVVSLSIIYSPKKSRFTEPLFQAHQREFELYTSLSDNDKIEYMNMPREEKIATYSAKLRV